MKNANAYKDIKLDPDKIVYLLKKWGTELGFDELEVSRAELRKDKEYFNTWLQQGLQGSMSYMERNSQKRLQPTDLIQGTISIITVRSTYLSASLEETLKSLKEPTLCYLALYARGRDYHKIIRKKLKRLAESLINEIGGFGYRVFTDSAPVLERALARDGGLGWIGKNTNLISKHDGSLFFLAEIYTDLTLPVSKKVTQNHCGTCSKCIDICPTKAILKPYVLDARRCISYLTIESKDSIPEEFRTAIGNRIFGCDDCQLVCPWNKYAKMTKVPEFEPRAGLKKNTLVELFALTENQFKELTRGSAIKRINHEQWLRNIAVGLGNAPRTQPVLNALESRLNHPSFLVREHVRWAINQHKKRNQELLRGSSEQNNSA